MTHPDTTTDSNRIKSWIAAASVGLTVLYAALHYVFRAPGLYSEWAILAVFVIGVPPLLIELGRGILAREAGVDLLAGICVITALVMHEYLAGAVILIMFFGGGALEDFALKRASSVLAALAKRIPVIAHVRKGAELADVPVADVLVGDLIEIFPHEICPVDGTVEEGHGTMNEAYLTGEPFQIDKTPGSPVISGAVNGDTPLVVRASKIAAQSRYAQIMVVMKQSERDRPRIRRMADRLGSWYAPLALTVAAAAWAFSGEPSRFLSVLVVATPCPLLIGVPVAMLGAISLCARRAIIVKRPSALEEVENCRVAVFDKTGTLTCGEPVFSEIFLAPGLREDKTLSMAASVERYSKHPLASAVLAEARRRRLSLHEVEKMRIVPGRGITASVSGHEIEITGRRHVAEADMLPSEAGSLECIVLLDGKYAATMRFHDAPRAESGSFVSHLGSRHQFRRTMIVSGDRESEAAYLARLVGIQEVMGGKSPEDKLNIIREITKKEKTLYVGDGTNDAPALMAATVGIAIGKNSDVASEAAAVVILDSSLAKVDEFMHIGRRFRVIALQSAIGGMVLSLLGMAAAASGHLSPLAGAMLQEGIDLVAILNAMRAALPPKVLSDFLA